MNFFKKALTYGLPFGALMSVTYVLNYGVLIGIVIGVISGVLFGCLLTLLLRKLQKRYQRVGDSAKELLTDKTEVIFDSYINHINGILPTDDWLFLTKTSLILMKKSKKKNPPLKIEFPLNQIQSVAVCKHRLNPDAFHIFINDIEHKFLVTSIKKNNYMSELFPNQHECVTNSLWVSLIERAMHNKTNFNNIDSTTYL